LTRAAAFGAHGASNARDSRPSGLDGSDICDNLSREQRGNGIWRDEDVGRRRD